MLTLTQCERHNIGYIYTVDTEKEHGNTRMMWFIQGVCFSFLILTIYFEFVKPNIHEFQLPL